ncbi:MAG: hypothetical protein IJ224_05520 [Lachnospiraceae bacterium]|nr:hypothetical protein [Lachnospiraceae bacterium]
MENGFQTDNINQIKPRKRTGVIIITVLIYFLSVSGLVAGIIIVKKSWEKDVKKFEKDYNEVVEQYNTIVSDYDTLGTNYNELKTNYESLESDYNSLVSDYEQVCIEYNALLAENEVTYEQPTNLDEYDGTVTYDDLARTPDDFEGKAIKIKGKVIQVTEDDGYTQLRVAVNSDYDNIIMVIYDSKIVDKRILEEDKITVYGLYTGLITYESVMGASITIPSMMIVNAIEIN